MDKRIIASLCMMPLFLNACATAPKSILLGAGIGLTAGAAAGQGISHDSTGTAIGALVGAGVGSLIGFLAHSEKEKKDEAAAVIRLPNEDGSPQLTKPRVRTYVVPDTVEGNKYIKSHRVFILEDPGAWSKE